MLDFYWGGPERRITTLTTRIIGVNAVALIMLLVGILFLGQYHANLIELKLENFNTEIGLISATISEAAIEDGRLDTQKTRRITRRLSQNMTQRIRIFDERGSLIVDSSEFTEAEERPQPAKSDDDDSFYTIRVLKSMAGFVIQLVPEKRTLPTYPQISSRRADDYPDAGAAMNGNFSLSAWNDEEGAIFLSAAAPLHKGPEKAGAVLLTRTARDINEDIGDVWLNVVGAFFLTLVITVLLSIYLSGVIASPLRRLARAAEGVRKGKLTTGDIPDFSDRRDEIGELSIAFKEMTSALWERMDSTERFAADVAHELKNPLTSLRSAIETASVVKKPADREKLMEIIRHDIDRLDRLITDISHASRLDSELSRDVFARVGLRKILKDLLGSYKDPLARESDKTAGWENSVKVNGVTIESSADIKTNIFVWGHEGRLEQVFQNLLTNALSFSPENGTVRIHVSKARKTVRVVFEDEGPGIPENKISSIFDRFYTQRPEHEDYGKHSGLGLSICKQIMTAMGGDIYAENIKDKNGAVKGARFSVILNKA